MYANGNLVFAEEPYDELGQYPNIYYRLLAVFRYWNTIEYFFPYKHIMDQDWDTTFDQFVFPIAYAENPTKYHFSLLEMVNYIDDSHSGFESDVISQNQGEHLFPFIIKWIEGKTVITAVHSSVTIATFARPDSKYAGRFYWGDAIVNYNNNVYNIYSGKIIILFNENSISQSEYTVMGLEQHPGAVKIGSQTSGADGNVSNLFLPGKIKTYFTGLGTYYPDGTSTQRVGIVPDIEVKPTISGIRNGIDEVLEFALNCELDTMIMNPDTMIIDPDTMIIDVDTMTGTDLVILDDFMKFYPNPFDNFLQIINTGNEVKEVKIFDVRGKLVSTENVIDFKMIDVSHLTSGIYIAQWNDNNQLMSQKLVKH